MDKGEVNETSGGAREAFDKCVRGYMTDEFVDGLMEDYDKFHSPTVPEKEAPAPDLREAVAQLLLDMAREYSASRPRSEWDAHSIPLATIHPKSAELYRSRADRILALVRSPQEGRGADEVELMNLQQWQSDACEAFDEIMNMMAAGEWATFHDVVEAVKTGYKIGEGSIPASEASADAARLMREAVAKQLFDTYDRDEETCYKDFRDLTHSERGKWLDDADQILGLLGRRPAEGTDAEQGKGARDD